MNQELIRDAMRYQLLIVLLENIKADQLGELQKLYDAAQITNAQLLQQLRQHRAPLTDIPHAVFADIAYILVDEIIEKADLDELFCALFDIRYPKSRTLFNKVLNAVAKNDATASNVLKDSVGYFVLGKDYRATADPGFRYFLYLIYKTTSIMELGVVTDQLIMQDADGWRTRQVSTAAEKINDSSFYFTDTQERIFGSKMYEKYVERVKARLVEYLGVNEKKLSQHFYNAMDFGVWKDDLSFLANPGIPGICNLATVHVIEHAYSSATWMQTITSPRDIRKGSLGYKPEIMSIIQSYCRAQVESVYSTKVKNGEEFYKSTLIRECMSSSPEIDYQAICYLYNIEIVNKMFHLVLERYYSNFSWEQFTHKSLLDRNNLIIDELRESVRLKDQKIIALQDELQEYESGLLRNNDSAVVETVRNNQKLHNLLDEKDKEIEELKNRIKSQDGFIDLLNSPEEAEDSQDVCNVTMLQSKKYLFVGFADEALPDLRRLFANSLFMNYEAFSTVNIEVDAVVLLIRFMSHGMLYKIKSRAKFDSTPIIICKGRRLNSVLHDMSVFYNDTFSNQN